MGAIYKAVQLSMDRVVALKILPQRLAKNENFIKRFIREARSAGQLNHPNIVRAIDAGEDEGIYFFAMEYVDGKNGAEIMKQEGVFAEKRAVQIFREVAQGLKHAHAHNIIHRDVKPDNILINRMGTAKICDLGLARAIEDDDMSLTRTGRTMGTPYYLSPEQARARKDIDARTDIYSLGVTLYHMLSGNPPFAGDSAAAVMAQHISEPPKPLSESVPGIHHGLAAIIHKCMEKQPDQRYASMDDLIHDISLLEQGKPPEALRKKKLRQLHAFHHDAKPLHRRTTAGETNGKGMHSALIPGIAAVGIIAVILFIWALQHNNRGSGPKTYSRDTGPESQESDESTSFSRDPSTRTVQDRRDYREMFNYAEQYKNTHPDDLEGIIGKFDKVRISGKGTKYELMAEDSIQNAVLAYRTGIQETAATFSKAGDFNGAINAWKNIPHAVAVRLRPPPAQEVRDLEKKALGLVQTAYDKAKQMETAGKYAEAFAVLDPVKHVAFQQWHGRIGRLYASLQNSVVQAAQDEAKRKTAAARVGFAQYAGAFVDATLKGDLRTAYSVAEKAASDNALKPLKQEVDRITETAENLKKVCALETRGIEKLKDGKEHVFQLKGGRIVGTVEEVTDNRIRVTCTGMIDGREIRYGKAFRISDLTYSARRGLRGGFNPVSGSEHIAEAVFAFNVKDIDRAEAELNSAGEHPLVPLYRKAIDTIRMGEAEVAAREAWDAVSGSIPGTLGPKFAEQVLARIASFEKEHGTTEYVKSIMPQIKALKERARNSIEHWTVLSPDTIPVQLSGGAQASAHNGILSITVHQGRGNRAIVPIITHSRNFRIQFEYCGPVVEMFLRKVQWRGCFLLLLAEDRVFVRTYPVENQGKAHSVTHIRHNGILPPEWHRVEIVMKDRVFSLSIDGNVLSHMDAVPAVARGDSYIEIYDTGNGSCMFRNIRYSVADRQTGQGAFTGIFLKKPNGNDWVVFKTDGEDVERKYVVVSSIRGGYEQSVLDMIKNVFPLNRATLEWRLENGQLKVASLRTHTPSSGEGVLTGVIREMGKGWLEIECADGTRERLIPRWIGGMPAQGGGLDKKTVQAISRLNPGEKVSIQWKFDVRKRICAVQRIP